MADEPVAFTRELKVDESYSKRVTWAIYRDFLRRPSTWTAVPVVFVGVALSFVAPIMVFASVLAAVALIVIVPMTYVNLRRSTWRTFRPGMVIRSGFGPDRFVTGSAEGSSTLVYSAIAGAERRGDFVRLRSRRTKHWLYYPGALFGDEDLARFPQA